MSGSMKQSSYWLFLLVLAPSSTILAENLVGLSSSEVFAEQTADNRSATPLSVAPLDHMEYPPDRPAWIDQTIEIDQLFGAEHRTATVVVVSGPSDTLDESLDELLVMQRAAVNSVIAQVTGHQDVDSVFVISDEEIDRDLVTRRYDGEVLQGDTLRYEHAVELQFSPKLRRAMIAAKDNIEVRHRLNAIGVMTLGGFLTLIGSSALIGFTLRRNSREGVSKGI